jgi:type I restriction enzyme M protein
MINASKGFIKDGNKNRLREQDIKKIIDVFEGQTELPKYSRFVPNEEILRNEYNLNIPRYIDTSEPEDAQDIEGHLKGGIPNADIEALADYWQVCPTLKDAIFKYSPRSGYSELSITIEEIRRTVLSHREFEAFHNHVLEVFASWRDKTTGRLRGISTKDHPKAIIQTIGDDLLATCADLLLIDKYDIYQHLMTYCAEVMQDDAYIITVDGWGAGNLVTRLKRETKDKNRDTKKKDIEGLSGLEGRLIPMPLLISSYFATEHNQLDVLTAKLEPLTAQMDELKDEHGGDEGLLVEVIEGDKVNKGSVAKRIKEVKDDADFSDELAVLQKYAALLDEEAETKRAIKEAEKDLERKVLSKYPSLSLAEIKTLVVERKWMDALATAVIGEVDRLSQALTGRIKELALRYAVPMPAIADEVEGLSTKVAEHLKNMGFVWE